MTTKSNKITPLNSRQSLAVALSILDNAPEFEHNAVTVEQAVEAIQNAAGQLPKHIAAKVIRANVVSAINGALLSVGNHIRLVLDAAGNVAPAQFDNAGMELLQKVYAELSEAQAEAEEMKAVHAGESEPAPTEEIEPVAE